SEGQSTEETFSFSEFERLASSCSSVFVVSITVSPQPATSTAAANSPSSTPEHLSKLIPLPSGGVTCMQYPRLLGPRPSLFDPGGQQRIDKAPAAGRAGALDDVA